LKHYFEGSKELFNDLAMEKLEKEWTKYPVIHLNLSRAKGRSEDEISDYLGRLLSDYEKLYGKVSDVHPGDKLESLIKQAYEKTGQRVVVIVDEYDAPMLEVLHEDEETTEAIRKIMRQFYEPLKSCEEYLKFVFITGITKFSQLSIFSTINHLKNISMTNKYAAICGITESELHSVFEDDIHTLSQELGLSYEETLQRLKEQYDGYHFCAKSEDIYNPFSLLSAFDNLAIRQYWFASGTPTYLIRQMKRFNIDVTTLDDITAAEINFDVPTERMTTAIPLLYQSGYLTIKGYDKDVNLYTLGIPNEEVRIGLMDSLIPLYTNLDSQNIASGLFSRFAKAIMQDDIDTAMQALRSYLAGIPYMSGDKEMLANEERAEAHYHLLFYIMFSFLNIMLQTEVRTARGRVDIVVHTKTSIYVFELKINRPAADALAQIDSKDYALPYEQDGRKVVKVGVSFSTRTGTVEEWIVG
jgi:flavodoxin